MSVDQLFDRFIDPSGGKFATDLAEYVLTLNFTDAQQRRYARIASKNNQGTISAKEREELEAFVHANSILSLLQLKATKSLKPRRRRAHAKTS
jgi:hypothetical protein